ncbi:MAG: Amidophosphoribosyltransferase precursor [Candidatus Omnitrophica bacterium ADurb.Bin277]|nr:MAG: Amidophosphoribosyltransferase precursor [Candidatus Omnitrophica bacterium ADurb.Bin277]
MSGENLKHYCGIFGIYNHPHAARITQLGLFALQHRGEEAAGICSSDGEKLHLVKGVGHVGDVFSEASFTNLPGKNAIGHVRYSANGSSVLTNAQPYKVDYSRGRIAIAHNGNLVNAQILRAELEAYGSIFGSTMDSEIFIHLLAKPAYRSHEEGIIEATRRVKGAFSLTILTEDQLIGVRDPHGFRPLCLGRIGDAFVLASETCAFDLIEAKFIREVEPGEVVVIDTNGVRSHFPYKDVDVPKAQCIFEHVYFARPDSTIFHDNVGFVRERLGRQLAKEHPVDADVVVPVPDSGNFAALGYSHESGIPLAHGFIRNHYIGRTFISPTEAGRAFKVKIKLNPIRQFVDKKRVIVVDDSIVRGNTAKNRVKLLRAAGAREVHMRISCPPPISPCFYGIGFPSKKELLAANSTMDEIKKFLDVDTLGYLSLDGTLGATTQSSKDFCSACFTGKYPTEIFDEMDKCKLEGKRDFFGL